jgi:hypothetical protein
MRAKANARNRVEIKGGAPSPDEGSALHGQGNAASACKRLHFEAQSEDTRTPVERPKTSTTHTWPF